MMCLLCATCFFENIFKLQIEPQGARNAWFSACNFSEPGKRATEEPTEIFKHENYGKIPAYLIENQRAVKQEKDESEARREMEKPTVRILPEKERQELLTGLKDEWNKTNGFYQQMTHLVQLDTIGKIRRKEAFETKLTQLEKDIETLSKPHVIVREA